MKVFLLIIFIFILESCAFKPLYKKSNYFSPHNVNIVVKSKEKFENNNTMMKLLLNEKINRGKLRTSNLKLVVSLDKNVYSMGRNKDLSSDARMLEMSVKYIFYDKKGKLMSGSLKGSSSFNYTINNYANLVSLEDASNKLIKSLSNDLADLLMAKSFTRNLAP